MADISKCNDHLCPSKTICYRFTAPVGIRQSYINTNRECDAYNCDLFWHNGKCKYCGQNENNHKLSYASQRATILMNLKKNKMTAVEFLVKGLPMVYWEDPYYSDLLEQAKEMEKQQIVDAHENGYKMGEHIYSEQYYNDKFNK